MEFTRVDYRAGTIEEQINNETEFKNAAKIKYMYSQETLDNKGNGSLSDAGAYVIKRYFDYLSGVFSTAISNMEKRTVKYSMYYKYLNTIDSGTLAHIFLKAIFDNTNNTIYKLASIIGSKLEAELRFHDFYTKYPDYYEEVIKDFKRKNSTDARYKRRVLTHSANKLEHKWESWSNTDKIKIGVVLIGIVERDTELIEREVIGNVTRITMSSELQNWVKQYTKSRAALQDTLIPLVVKPNMWESTHQLGGGYYSKSNDISLVINDHKSADGVHMPKVLKAINALQSTPWRVNSKILDVLTYVYNNNLQLGIDSTEPYEIPECPFKDVSVDDLNTPEYELLLDWKRTAAELHTENAKRVSKVQIASTALSIATKLREYSEIYFQVCCDFRGRAYYMGTGLNPQGTDIGKALLQFGVAKPLTKAGVPWFKLHGANVWGFDKLSFAERLQKIDDSHDILVAIGNDPMSNTDVWSNADKPYQFLAFCIEYAGFAKYGDAFRSRLPIALDGSCNGLQHLSAILRDSDGGSATNLIDADVPSDIYGIVAEKTIEKLRASGSSLDIQLISLVDRKLCKKPVMTLPYGSTYYSCVHGLVHHFTEHAIKLDTELSTWKICMYLGKVIWDTIKDTVISASRVMDWLSNVAAIVSKYNEPIVWTSPVGFFIRQKNTKVKKRRVRSYIDGLTLVLQEYTDDIDSAKQRSSLAPNFIHSLDAAHMMSTVNTSLDEGIDSFACIHDDFGVHACDTGKFYNIIRREFFNLHNTNVLFRFKEQVEEALDIELPNIPTCGDLQLSSVLTSKYFFS